MGVNDGLWHCYVYDADVNGRSTMYIDGVLNMQPNFNPNYKYQTAQQEIVWKQNRMVGYKQWMRRVV